MSPILLIITCELLLAVTDGSDKHLKELPKTEQAIETESENTTETVVVFAPPLSDYIPIEANDESALCDTSRDATGFCSGYPGEGSARGHNYTGEPVTFVSQSVSTGTSTEDKNGDVRESVNDLIYDIYQQKTVNEPLDEGLSHVPETKSSTKDNTLSKEPEPPALYKTSDESLFETVDYSDIEEVGLSQLDQSVADVPISELKASVYKELADVLESTNTRDGTDPWWNYLILNHDDLEINRRQQRHIEKSQRPGLEFLDIVDEIGYTLQDLMSLFMRFQIHEALDLLRSHQFEGRRNDHRTVSERGDEASYNFLNDVSGIGDSNQNDREGNDALNDKKDITSVDSTIDKTDTSAEEKTHTPDVDHCGPNPCKHEGKCISDENSYSCKCPYKWYSGKNCEIDRGPCINACFKPGTSSCYYTGPGGENTVCNCKVGYDGDQCETGHDYAAYPLVRDVIDSCNERGLSKDECIADTLGVDTDVNSLEGLIKAIDAGEVKISDIFGNVVNKVFLQSRKFFGDDDVENFVDKLKNIFN